MPNFSDPLTFLFHLNNVLKEKDPDNISSMVIKLDAGPTGTTLSITFNTSMRDFTEDFQLGEYITSLGTKTEFDHLVASIENRIYELGVSKLMS